MGEFWFILISWALIGLDLNDKEKVQHGGLRRITFLKFGGAGV